MYVSYSNNGGLSWSDFLKVNAELQTERRVGEVAYQIEESSRKQIATLQQISNEQIVSIEQNTQAVREGTEVISLKLDAIDQNLGKLQATFDWGFNAILMELGSLNKSLEQLIKIAKTPSQTWAFEQYSMARDNFRRGLYEESIEPLNRSIEGYGDNTGYPTDHRFHYLMGVIRLGDFDNHSDKIVNPKKAYDAFSKAGKYAEHDYPSESFLAYLSAGWAAYILGDLENAKKSTNKAIALDYEQPQAHFQLAKILVSEASINSAIPHLKTAIKQDANYSLKAVSDESFKPYINEVNQLLQDITKEYTTLAKHGFDLMEDQIKKIKNVDNNVSSILNSAQYEIKHDNRGYFEEFDSIVLNAKKEAGEKTLFGVKNAIVGIGELLRKKFEVKDKLIPSENDLRTAAKKGEPVERNLGQLFGVISAVLTITILIYNLSNIMIGGGWFSTILMNLVTLFIIFPIIVWLAYMVPVLISEIMYGRKKRAHKKEKERIKRELNTAKLPSSDLSDEDFKNLIYNNVVSEREINFVLGMIYLGEYD